MGLGLRLAPQPGAAVQAAGDEGGFEIENMMWTEVMQSDDAQLALKTYIDVDLDSRRDWFESESSKNYPAYSGH